MGTSVLLDVHARLSSVDLTRARGGGGAGGVQVRSGKKVRVESRSATLSLLYPTSANLKIEFSLDQI